MFASNTGTALNARNVARRGFEPALKEAGLYTAIPKITFHDLRHAFASLMVAQGANSIELATVMGHRDSRTTETIYIHLFDRERSEEQIRAAIKPRSPLNMLRHEDADSARRATRPSP